MKNTATLIAVLAVANSHADVIDDYNLLEAQPRVEAATIDTVIGASAGTGLMAGIASWALPAAIAHSSGGALLYSGAGYVAGTMGLAAGTVAALPFIAGASVVVGTGAVVYKYYGEEIDELVDQSILIVNEYSGDDQ